MARVFTDFERWVLSLPVPSWNLPALVEPTYLELIERAELVGYTGAWKQEGEKGLASIAIKLLGLLSYLEKECNSPLKD
jgi:hypothetical protein